MLAMPWVRRGAHRRFDSTQRCIGPSLVQQREWHGESGRKVGPGHIHVRQLGWAIGTVRPDADEFDVASLGDRSNE